MQSLTLQLYNRGKWWDAADLIFSSDTMSGVVTIAYIPDYIISVLEYGAADCWAYSVNAPVDAIPTEYPNWPALLDDLLPVGKSRDWWLKYLNASRKSEFEQNLALLLNACMAPVGNLRIKEAFNQQPRLDETRFAIQNVIQLQHDFLEYANENGAAVGGATGAGGVAPKLLLMLEDEEVYINGDFAGKPLSATAYLTKFARNTRSQRDNNILRAEGVYYQALTEILVGTGIDTIDISKMKTLEHEGQVSLWLPRFDISIENGVAHRLGLESIYSIINAEPGSYQNHFEVMSKVWQRINKTTQMTSAEFVKQYVARDFLNLVFGNSDNHGRNISFLKLEGDINFAPIYDFAPMKADPEMVTRLFKWGDQFESRSVVNFKLVAEALDEFITPEHLVNYLEGIANKLIDLPILLEKLNCPEEIIHFPAIGYSDIKNKLTQMGVWHD